MNDHNLYTESQHGFWKHSCVTQLLNVIKDLSEMSDNGDPYDIIYFDY